MMWWWWSDAVAGSLPWAGDWALDPTQSDDGPQAIERLVRGAPIQGGRAAARMSPDPASSADVASDDRQRLVDALTKLLARSGRIELTAAEDGVTVEYSGEDPVTLPFGRKWTKVRWDGSKVKLRAQVGNALKLERRVSGATVVETFLPLEQEGEAAVVVRIDGAGVQATEFRRVYRDVTP